MCCNLGFPQGRRSHRKELNCLTKKRTKIRGKWIPITKIKMGSQHKMKLLLALSKLSLQCHTAAASVPPLLQRLSTTTMLIPIRIKTLQKRLSILPHVCLSHLAEWDMYEMVMHAVILRKIELYFFFHLEKVFAFCSEKKNKNDTLIPRLMGQLLSGTNNCIQQAVL